MIYFQTVGVAHINAPNIDRMCWISCLFVGIHVLFRYVCRCIPRRQRHLPQTICLKTAQTGCERVMWCCVNFREIHIVPVFMHAYVFVVLACSHVLLMHVSRDVCIKGCMYVCILLMNVCTTRLPFSARDFPPLPSLSVCGWRWIGNKSSALVSKFG